MLIATYQRKIICIWVNCKLYSCHGDLRIIHWGIIFVEYEPPYMHLLSRHTLSWLCLYSLSPPNMTLSNIHRHIREVGCLSPLHHYQNTSTYNQDSRRNLSSQYRCKGFRQENSGIVLLASTNAIKLSENLSSSRTVKKSPNRKLKKLMQRFFKARDRPQPLPLLLSLDTSHDRYQGR